MLAVMAIALTLFWTAPLYGQSTISGGITGTVSDPSGAVVPNATVTLKNDATGQTQTQTTNSSGVYRFSFLNPGTYTLTTTAPNFQSASSHVGISVGQTTTNNIKLALSSASQTVTVTSEAPVLQTENGNVSTTFSAAQISLIPNPGNDMSYVAQTSPGANMNTQAGYGNFETFGLPGTSNLFTVNGQYENDPFLNLNNSGATNLLLGSNDVQEATVVNNGYSGQYGGLAGANINYVSKSGGNAWHGNASYWWNGRVLNANNYFNKQSPPITPRPFVNDNQWAASIGGPIKKDKTFFFVDTEGLRVLIPVIRKVNIPSPQFEAATLANLAGTNPGEIPFYQRMFNLYNNANGAKGAANVLPSGGCAAGTTPFTGLPAGVPCALQFNSNQRNATNEWLLTGRLDQNIGANDHAFIHFRTDHGLQATYTDPISPIFNAQSNQPQWEGQLNETHTFGAAAVNQFILSGSYYRAIFQPANMNTALRTMPFEVGFTGRAFYGLGRDLSIWPQGRNVTQYQIVDDFSKPVSVHNLKFGLNFKRNDVTDYDPGAGSIGFLSSESLASFFSGLGDNFIQAFPARLTQPVALYNLGAYAQDEWRVSNAFKLTLSLRVDHNSNPVCITNCFARLRGTFQGVAHDPAIPYSQALLTGQHQAVGHLQGLAWEPRMGFAWQLRNQTVLRGGIGLFADAFPATVSDFMMNNPPNYNQFVASSAPFAPGIAGNLSSIVSGANTSFLNSFRSGGTLASISAANPLFTPPSVYNANRINYPQYQEWNLELQQGLGQRTSLNLNYVGNHGIYEPVQNSGLNAFCGACMGTASFRGLTATAPDPRFGTVTEAQTNAVSNYNGLTVSLQRKFTSLQVQANYTWSHALDEISNGGFLPFNFLTNESVLSPQDPYNIRRFNYGNADYDVRQSGSLNYVYNMPQFRGIVSRIFGGWVVSGTLFVRTGLPFTVVDGNATGTLASNNFGGPLNGAGAYIFANDLNRSHGGECGDNATNPASPCLSLASFSPATSGFGNQRRNQFYGPRFFNTDLTLMKNFGITENVKLGVGATAFNILNHPNFDQPVADIANPNFGTIISTVNPPTSIYGSFLGGDASPRVIQLNARLTF
ncbi:MAG TPA: carboxypeptidase regulatory-like domain-containing protein [Terriglobales bacterium]